MQICATLVKGKARIQFNATRTQYSLARAQQSFKSLVHIHEKNGESRAVPPACIESRYSVCCRLVYTSEGGRLTSLGLPIHQSAADATEKQFWSCSPCYCKQWSRRSDASEWAYIQFTLATRRHSRFSPHTHLILRWRVSLCICGICIYPYLFVECRLVRRTQWGCLAFPLSC